MKDFDSKQLEFLCVLDHFMKLALQGVVEDPVEATFEALGAVKLFENFGEDGWGPLAAAAGAQKEDVARVDEHCRFLYGEYLIATSDRE